MNYKIIEDYIEFIAAVKHPFIKKTVDSLVPFYRKKYYFNWDLGLEKFVVLTVNIILIYF